MGFSYDEHQKSYFTDRHEDEGNRDYQKIHIEKYTNLEQQTYQCFQISKGPAKNLRYKMREYHINIYHRFVGFTPTMLFFVC